MDTTLLLKIVMAGFFGYLIWRMLPAAKYFFEHGLKGSSRQWLTTAMLLGGVVLFVIVLIALVSN